MIRDQSFVRPSLRAQYYCILMRQLPLSGSIHLHTRAHTRLTTIVDGLTHATPVVTVTTVVISDA